MQKKFSKIISFLLPSWRSMMKISGSIRVRCMNPRIRIRVHTKMDLHLQHWFIDNQVWSFFSSYYINANRCFLVFVWSEVKYGNWPILTFYSCAQEVSWLKMVLMSLNYRFGAIFGILCAEGLWIFLRNPSGAPSSPPPPPLVGKNLPGV